MSSAEHLSAADGEGDVSSACRRDLSEDDDTSDEGADCEDVMGELYAAAAETRCSTTLFKRTLERAISCGFDPEHHTYERNVLQVAMSAKNTLAMRDLFYFGLYPCLRNKNDDGDNDEVMNHAMKNVLSKKVLSTLRKLDALQSEVTKLQKAVLKGDLEEVKNMRATLQSTDLAWRDAEGMSPLHYACVRGSRPIVQQLMDAGANPRALNFEEQNVLHLASKHGSVDVLEYLLNRMSEHVGDKDAINDKDESEKSPVIYTAGAGSYRALQLLLEVGGAVFTADVLSHAAAHGCLEYIKRVVKGCEVPLTHIDERGKSLLHHAADAGHIRVVDYILGKLQGDDLVRILTQKDTICSNVLHACCGTSSETDVLMERILEKAKICGVVEDMVNVQEHYTGARFCVLVTGKDQG